VASAVAALVAPATPSAGATQDGPLVFSRVTSRTTNPFNLYDLYVRRLDGSVARLTNALAEPGATAQGGYGYADAAPSRTGAYVLTTRVVGSNSFVELLGSSGRRVRTLSTGCNESHAGTPRWLSDTKVLFLGHDNAWAYTVNLDGTSCAPYASLGGPMVWGAAVSPDRTRVALSVMVGDHFQVAVQAPNGTGRRVVTASAVDLAEPAWAPDGRRLVVRRGDAFARSGGLGILTVPATGTTAVTAVAGVTAGWAPAFTRDGAGLLYAGPSTAPGIYSWRAGTSRRLTTAADGPAALLLFSGATTLTVPRPTSAVTTGLAFPVGWGAPGGTRYTVDWARRVLSNGTWVTSPWARWRTLTSTTSGTFGAGNVPVAVAQGTSYWFRVVAYDAYGSHGPAVTARAVVPYDVTATRQAWSGPWGTSSGVTGRWLGTLRSTSTRGASMTVARTTTNALQLVGDRCPTCGQVQVWLDGTLRATVDTGATTTRVRQLLWASPALSFTGHTLRVVNLGTAGRPLIRLDAVVVAR
jgi:hypothetical protein